MVRVHPPQFDNELVQWMIDDCARSPSIGRFAFGNHRVITAAAIVLAAIEPTHRKLQLAPALSQERGRLPDRDAPLCAPQLSRWRHLIASTDEWNGGRRCIHQAVEREIRHSGLGAVSWCSPT